jgi:hypothetical protein
MSRTMRVALLSGILGAFAALTVSAAIASSTQSQTAKGGTISAVTAVSSSARTLVSVPAGKWATIPGASVRVSVPAGWRSALLVATLNADGICSGGECRVRMVVDGHVANPVANTDGFLIGQRNATVLRWLTVRSGTHTVRVQVGIGTGSAGLVRMDDWSFIVERAKSA